MERARGLERHGASKRRQRLLTAVGLRWAPELCGLKRMPSFARTLFDTSNVFQTPPIMIPSTQNIPAMTPNCDRTIAYYVFPEPIICWGGEPVIRVSNPMRQGLVASEMVLMTVEIGHELPDGSRAMELLQSGLGSQQAHAAHLFDLLGTLLGRPWAHPRPPTGSRLRSLPATTAPISHASLNPPPATPSSNPL